MNWVDIAILCTIVGSTLAGFFWGIIRQAVSIIGLWGGIILAGRLYQPVADLLHGPDGGGIIADASWAKIIAFGLVIIVFSLLLGILGSVLRLVLKLFFLGWVDNVLGALLGFLTSLVFVTSLLVVAIVFPVPNVSEAIKESVLAQWVGGFTPVVLAMLPPEFQTFRQMMNWGPI